MRLTIAVTCLALSLFAAGNLNAQANDCATATTICNNPPASGNPSGNGGFDDFSDPDNDPGCLTSEGNTAWYYFEIPAGAPSGLELGFTIFPDGGFGEDYDWALFGPNVDCGDLGSPIRCSSASGACGFCPETGMGMGATDETEGPGFGDGFVATLQVEGGQGFYIAINNWYGTGNGFTLEFTGSAAPYLDCTADPPCSVEAIAGDDITVCEAAPPFSINVTPDGGLPPYTFNWEGTNNGTSYLDDPSAQSPLVTLPSGITGTVNYYVTVSDGICQDIDTLVVNINPAPTILIDPMGPFCTNDPDTYQATGSPSNGTWGGIANAGGQVTPGNFNPGTRFLTLTAVTAEGCPGTDSIPVEFVAPETIVIQPVDPLCESSPPYEVQVTPTGGTWSGDVGPDGKIYPDLLGPGTFVANYEYVSLEGCVSVATLIFDIFADPEPVIIDPGPLCSDQNTVQLEADPFGGTWSGSADPLGNVFPFNLGPGTYQAVYTFADANGCVGRDSIPVIVNDPPTADLEPVIVACNSPGGNNPPVVDFDDLILGGDPNGLWEDIDNSGASGTFPVLDFSGVPAGSYTFHYTTQSAQGSCEEFEGSVEVIVEDCGCPSVALIPGTPLCNDMASLDLNSLKITTEPGSWQIIAVPAGSNPASLAGTAFFGTGRDTGAYQVRFTLTVPPPAGCPTSNTAIVSLYPPPSATLPATVKACNASGTGDYPSVLDLSGLISAGDKGGNWSNISGVNTSGPFSALDFEYVQPGTYAFEYTTNSAVAPCQEKAYTLQVEVVDCTCPDISYNPPGDLCNDNGTLNLNSLITSAPPGSWSITQAPSGSNPATIAGGIFQAGGRDPGQYFIRYSLSTPPPTGCPPSAEDVLTVIAAPSASLKPQLSACNSLTSGQEPTTLNFNDFLISGDLGGSWTAVGNSGATGSFPVLDFTGVAPGLYDFTYTTNSATAPCPEKSYTVKVLVRNCLCPDLNILPAADACNGDAVFDLQTLIVKAAPGTWSLGSIPAGASPSILAGNKLNIQGAPAGSYNLIYTLQTPPPAGCPDKVTSTVLLSRQPLAGTPAGPARFCEGSDQLLALSSQLVNTDPGGTWSYNGVPGGWSTDFNAQNGTLQVRNMPPGTYLFTYSLNADPPCSPVTRDITVEIGSRPFADAGPDQDISCVTPTVTIGPPGPFPQIWTLQWTGPGLNGSTVSNPTVTQAGTFILLVTDIISGCIDRDTVSVTFSGTAISGFNALASPAACPEASNGAISLSAVTGGTPPFAYSLNGGPGNLSGQFDGLPAGTYAVRITDAEGCIRDTVLTILAGNGISVDLGPDRSVLIQTPVDIQAVVSPPTASIGSVVWNPAPPGGCNGCLQFPLVATETVTYEVTVRDVNGCEARDEVTINVRIPRLVYIPSAFSPNGDGINDILYVQGGDAVTRVRHLAVYDRWGNAVFLIEDSPPNDPAYGWDGSFRGRPVDQAVYVYAALVEFVDGETRLFKGDVLVSETLKR